MISLFLVSTIACYTNFDELANALTAGKYYAIGYTTGATPTWATTEIATADITTQTKRTYCPVTGNCPNFDDLPDRLKYQYTYEAESTSICKDKSAAEVAAAYLYGLHTAEKPSLYYITGCAEDGKDFEDAETTHTAGKCATQTTHPLSALQGIVDKYPYKYACYPIPETDAAPVCAKPATGCTDETVYAKYQAEFKLGYANKISFDTVKDHIKNFGPIVMKLNLMAADDLKTIGAQFETPKGIYCATKEATYAAAEWVEVVGFGTDTLTFAADEELCGVEQTLEETGVEFNYLVARSQYAVNYYATKEDTFFKVPLTFERDTLNLTNPIKDAASDPATYSGFFLYTSKFAVPTGTAKKIAAYGVNKIVKLDEFTEANYIKLKSGKEADAAFTLWTDDDIKANAQASQLHSATSNQVASSKFVIDAVYLTAKLHGEALTGVASVAGTVGTVASAIGYGDNVNFMEVNTVSKKYDPTTIDAFFPLGLSEPGLVLASCLSEKAADIYTYDTTDCDATANAAVTRVAIGLKTLVISGATEADLKKAVAYYGPVVATFLIDATELAAHLNGRTTDTKNDPYVITASINKMTVLVVGWGEYTPEGSNAAHTKWYVKVNSPTCTNCEPTGEGKFGTFTYVTGATAAPVPDGYIYAFVKAKGVEPGPDAALSFLPPLKPFLFIASLLFLLL